MNNSARIKHIWILTLFPEYFNPLRECGVVGQALRGERGELFELHVVQIREFTFQRYKGVDDTPFGGGAGMVMRADVLKNALLKGVVEAGGYGDNWRDKLHVIYPGPRGKVWQTQAAKEFAQRFWSDNENATVSKDVVFICGRYEGVDERFIEGYVNEQWSVGDYILSGGELAVMTIIDSAMRFVPGCLGNALSHQSESFEGGLLEYPLYTRPREFDGKVVPEILMSGHHKKIDEYLGEQSVRLTQLHRPDLLERKNFIDRPTHGSSF